MVGQPPRKKKRPAPVAAALLSSAEDAAAAAVARADVSTHGSNKAQQEESLGHGSNGTRGKASGDERSAQRKHVVRADLEEPLVRKGPWLVGARVRSPQQEGGATFFNATVHSLKENGKADTRDGEAHRWIVTFDDPFLPAAVMSEETVLQAAHRYTAAVRAVQKAQERMDATPALHPIAILQSASSGEEKRRRAETEDLNRDFYSGGARRADATGVSTGAVSVSSAWVDVGERGWIGQRVIRMFAGIGDQVGTVVASYGSSVSGEWRVNYPDGITETLTSDELAASVLVPKAPKPAPRLVPKSESESGTGFGSGIFGSGTGHAGLRLAERLPNAEIVAAVRDGGAAVVRYAIARGVEKADRKLDGSRQGGGKEVAGMVGDEGGREVMGEGVSVRELNCLLVNQIPPRLHLWVNQPVECEEGRFMYPARVMLLDADLGRVKVHFNDWNARHDRWIVEADRRIRLPADEPLSALPSAKEEEQQDAGDVDASGRRSARLNAWSNEGPSAGGVPGGGKSFLRIGLVNSAGQPIPASKYTTVTSMVLSIEGLPGIALASAARSLTATLRTPGHSPNPSPSVCHLPASVHKAKERGWRPDYAPLFPFNN